MAQIVEYIDELVGEVGPRPAASQAEHNAARLLDDHFAGLGLDSRIEEFQCSRNVNWVRALYFILGAAGAIVLFLLPDLGLVSLLLAALALLGLALDLLGKNPLFDLLNRGLSQNVVARYTPPGTTDKRRKVVVIAHYDSGRAMVQAAPALIPHYRLLRRIVRIDLAVLFLVLLLAVMPFAAAIGFSLKIIALVLGIIALVAGIVEVVNMFMPYNEGANCNGSGVGVLLGLAERLTASPEELRRIRSSASRPRRSRQRRSEPEQADDDPKDRGLRKGMYKITSRDGRGDDGPDNDADDDGYGSVRATDSRADDDATIADERIRSGVVRRRTPKGGEVAVAAVSASIDADEGRDAFGGLGRGRPRRTSRAGMAADVAGMVPARPVRDAEGLSAGEEALSDWAEEQQTREPVDYYDKSVADNLANPFIHQKTSAAATTAAGAAVTGEPRLQVAPTPAPKAAEPKAEPGVPAWYAKAKANAEKKAEGHSAAAADNSAYRSKFADVPVGTGASLKTRGDAQRAEAAEEEQTANLADTTQAGVDIVNTTMDSALVKGAQSTALAVTGAVPRVPEAPQEAEGPAWEPEPIAEDDMGDVGELQIPASNAAPTVDFPPISPGSPGSPDSSAGPASPASEEPALADAGAQEEAVRPAIPLTQQADLSGLDRSAFNVLRGGDGPRQTSVVPVIDVALHDDLEDQPQVDLDDHIVDEPLPEAPVASEAHTAKPASRPDLPDPQPTDDPPATGRHLSPDSLPPIVRGASSDVTGSGPGRAPDAVRGGEAKPLHKDPRSRLLDLPLVSAGVSGKIPAQQAGLETGVAPIDPLEPVSDSPVSRTGSFAPLGATGVMKPIGEELLDYHQEDGIYIEDADDSSINERYTEGGSYSSSEMVSMPDSRVRSFFGSLGDRISGGKKKDKFESSPSSWLGVDEDFDARREGSEIGSWDNFSEEDEGEGWKGGAYGGESYESNSEALAELSSELLDKEVWLVALGGHESKNAGIKALLKENASELRNAMFINIEGVGVGDLCFTIAEGTFRSVNTDHRLQNLISATANAQSVDIAPVRFTGYATDAAEALAMKARAISIIGLGKDLPIGWHWSGDTVDVLEEENLQVTADLVLEVIKSS